MALKRGIFFETLLPRPRNDYMETPNETQLLSYENQRVFFGFGWVVVVVFRKPDADSPAASTKLAGCFSKALRAGDLAPAESAYIVFLRCREHSAVPLHESVTGLIAQLAEQLTLNQRVRGSSPC